MSRGNDVDPASLEGTAYVGRITRHDAASFGETIQGLLKLYPPEIVAAQLNLLDSHDTARFVTTARGDETAWRLSSRCVFWCALNVEDEPVKIPAFPGGHSLPENVLLLDLLNHGAERKAYPVGPNGLFGNTGTQRRSARGYPADPIAGLRSFFKNELRRNVNSG